jgi:hypothetical protein
MSSPEVADELAVEGLVFWVVTLSGSVADTPRFGHFLLQGLRSFVLLNT